MPETAVLSAGPELTVAMIEEEDGGERMLSGVLGTALTEVPKEVLRGEE
jgi:hypothetical protein